MSSRLRNGWALLAAAILLANAALAQAPPADAEDADADAETTPAEDADILKGIDVDKLDWSQLNVDASTLEPLTPRGTAKQSAGGSDDAAWSSNPNANGSSAVSVRQSISPFWDTRVGADMTVARQGTLTSASEQMAERLANGGSLPQSSGSAWAAVTAPGVSSVWDKTSVEARIDPGAEQSRIGASLTKSVPFTDDTSLTLQNGYHVIEQGSTAVPGLTGQTSHSTTTEQSAKLDVNGSGTSFVAGQTLSSTDGHWLRSVGAEQKLFGGVTVRGSVGETAQGAANKSISAGFRRSW